MSLSRLAKALIQGAQDAGETLASYPIVIAGVDGTSTIRSLVCGSGGTLQVDSIDLANAAALADGAANPTTTMVGACNLIWNASTWDRWLQHPNSTLATAQGVPAVGLVIHNPSNDQRLAAAAFTGDAQSLGRVLEAGIAVSNGVTADRVVAANTANGTAGTGVPACGVLTHDMTGSLWYRKTGRVGAQANAWSAAVTGVNGTSTAIDTGDAPHILAFGNVSGATTITLQLSQDNSNWYDSGLTSILPGSGDFAIIPSGGIGARYARLKSSASVTATASIVAKG